MDSLVAGVVSLGMLVAVLGLVLAAAVVLVSLAVGLVGPVVAASTGLAGRARAGRWLGAR
jgi:hypothetical protein